MDRQWKRALAVGMALTGGIVGGLWDVSAEAAPGERRLVLRPSASEAGREASGESLLSKWISRSAAANAPAGESASDRGGRLRLIARKPSKPESTEPVVSADSDEIVIPGLEEIGDNPPSASSSSRSRGRR